LDKIQKDRLGSIALNGFGWYVDTLFLLFMIKPQRAQRALRKREMSNSDVNEFNITLFF